MKRRDFLQLIGLAGVAAVLPAPLQALTEGPLDEELPLELALNGHDVRSIECYIPELRNIARLEDSFERFVSIGPSRIRLELNWSPSIQTMLEPGALVNLEINLENAPWSRSMIAESPWKVKADVKSCRFEYKESVLSVELLPAETVKR